MTDSLLLLRRVRHRGVNQDTNPDTGDPRMDASLDPKVAPRVDSSADPRVDPSLPSLPCPPMRIQHHSGNQDADPGTGGPRMAPRADPGADPGRPCLPSPPRRGRCRCRRRRFYPERRVYRSRCSFLELSEEQVVRRYRLDKEAIAGLCRELGADLQSLTGRSHALPVAVKVTSALTFLATGSFQTATRQATGISQSAMSNCLAQFLEALQRRATRYITFPTAAAGSAAAGTVTTAFPGVLGLVGAMHVALRAPSENEKAFRNAANFHSINMQLVCDAAGTITNVVAKFPGSCPNATVLENSALAKLLDSNRMEGTWLLGDLSYPLKPWLMTPIAVPHGAAELRYNALHGAAMAALRRTRALLRLRFRCLAKGRGRGPGGPHSGGGGLGGTPLQYAPPKVCQIFLACCILHNIALRRGMALEVPPEGGPGVHGDPPPEPAEPPRLGPQLPDVELDPAPGPPPGAASSEARAVRARIVQRVREGLG